MPRGIRFSLDTERTAERLAENPFASSRSEPLSSEKGGKLAFSSFFVSFFQTFTYSGLLGPAAPAET